MPYKTLHLSIHTLTLIHKWRRLRSLYSTIWWLHGLILRSVHVLPKLISLEFLHGITHLLSSIEWAGGWYSFIFIYMAFLHFRIPLVSLMRRSLLLLDKLILMIVIEWWSVLKWLCLQILRSLIHNVTLSWLLMTVLLRWQLCLMLTCIHIRVKYPSLKHTWRINWGTSLLLHIWLIDGLLIVALVHLIHGSLLVNSILNPFVSNALSWVLLMQLLVLLGHLMTIVLLIIGIFHLLLRWLVILIQVLLKLYHVGVCLVLRRVKRLRILVLLIGLVHFSAIKFIILNYNFSTAKSLYR
jgi:hypothetical protein